MWMILRYVTITDDLDIALTKVMSTATGYLAADVQIERGIAMLAQSIAK
jgi:hypothetical protein